MIDEIKKHLEIFTGFFKTLLNLTHMSTFRL